MSSLLQSTKNTRFLPTGTMRYIRSDAPIHLTDQEIRWLLKHQVTTIVDLRSGDEALRHPCPLETTEGFRYFHLPVTGGGDTPKSREHLHTVYRQMLDRRMDEILNVLLNAPENAMYFCTAGKDRTGVVSALLLKRLGFSDAEIIADYMKSGENLMDMLTAHVKSHPEVDIDIIVPHEENIMRLLKELSAK